MPGDSSSSSVHLDAANQRLVLCERLPTPIPLAQTPGALLSPPLSRSPSPPRASHNTGTGPSPKLVSPLPTPSSVNSELRQVGKKTSAFFGNPFERHISTPPPPSPIRRQTTPSIIRPPSLPSGLSDCVVKSENPVPFLTKGSATATPPSNPDPPLHDFIPPISPNLPPSRSQSANTSAFFANGSATLTPPSSAHSSSSADDDPTSYLSPDFLPLSPSHATVDHDFDLSDDPGIFGDSFPNQQPFFLPNFMTIDDIQPITSPTDPEASHAPTPTTQVPRANTNQLSDPESVSLETIHLTKNSIVGTEIPLRLVRELGHGAFSCVWLAFDVESKLEKPRVGSRLRSMSMARKKSDKTVHGLRPHLRPSTPGNTLARSGSVYFAPQDGEGATISGNATERAEESDCDPDGRRLFAVKMIDRAACDDNDRMRISFVREVEVLRHISHPSIVSYIHSLTTPTHHCLVLEAVQGGELFELLDQGDNHSRITEPLVRRIFGELCQAVGWMHGVGLVHRDLKLENILLITNPVLTPLSSLPSTLIKLTDFGLARFIDPVDPLLVTRCGSESYAAPEIVTGKLYDGRQTDAWACGIVLYALATCTLPFDRPRGSDRDTHHSHLMRIAQGEYTWPEPEARLATEGLKSVVARLLVRDATRRARVVDLWDDPWMRGEGAPAPPLSKAGLAASGCLVGEDIPSVAKQEL